MLNLAVDSFYNNIIMKQIHPLSIQLEKEVPKISRPKSINLLDLDDDPFSDREKLTDDDLIEIGVFSHCRKRFDDGFESFNLEGD